MLANSFLHFPDEEVHFMQAFAGELYFTEQLALGFVDVLLIR